MKSHAVLTNLGSTHDVSLCRQARFPPQPSAIISQLCYLLLVDRLCESHYRRLKRGRSHRILPYVQHRLDSMPRRQGVLQRGKCWFCYRRDVYLQRWPRERYQQGHRYAEVSRYESSFESLIHSQLEDELCGRHSY
jgi:hypothetical protein